MMRLLRQLDRLDDGKVRRPDQPHADLGRRVLTVLVATGLFAAGAGLVAHRYFGLVLDADGIRVLSPLGDPPEVTDTSGTYAFILTQDGSAEPVAYDPCRPVRYVVNETLAPLGARALLDEAISEISAATGLVFVDEGSTDALPVSDTNDLGHSRPVHIGWTSPEVVADLAGRVAGVGGSTPMPQLSAGRLQYVTGNIALDAPQLTQVLQRSPDGAAHVRAIIMHELGHLVGLGHVDDPSELMYADNVGLVSFGPGDRQGLAALGSGPCGP